ncbi:hypothetical protein NDU88_003235 [Pleurodeles waltl]|uniref:Uncharacterized protein n=1 Tax=Pleurodeles waltl TaxID=8319 RepID=A0AAV7MPZ0_PLEWA|nr:hypothetical protein NDU88_003235 [Pleurodeles waltl]
MALDPTAPPSDIAVNLLQLCDFIGPGSHDVDTGSQRPRNLGTGAVMWHRLGRRGTWDLDKVTVTGDKRKEDAWLDSFVDALGMADPWQEEHTELQQ